MIPVYKPFLPKETYKYLNEVLDSGWISQGKYVQIVQERLAELLGVRFVLLTNNGTTATHLVTRVINDFVKDAIFPIGVVVPNNCYVAVWNTLLYEQLHPYPIDCNSETWNIDLNHFDFVCKYKDVTTALIVHNLGNIIDVPTLKLNYPHINFFEDNCEGFLGEYSNGKKSGTGSIAASLSFYSNKMITCGEGGAFITKDSFIYEQAKKWLGQGQTTEKFIHDTVGYNYRMTDIQASILCGQLDLLPEILERKEEIWRRYNDSIYFEDGFSLVCPQLVELKSPKWMYGVRIFGSYYDKAKKFFDSKGIETRPMFYPMSRHAHLESFSNKSAELNATTVNNEGLILPSYPELTGEEQKYILNTLKEYCETLR